MYSPKRPIVIAIALALLIMTGPAFAKDIFGAIFYSPGTGAVGAWHAGISQTQSDDFAKGFCGIRNAKDCVLAVRFKNSCGALYISPTGGWAAGKGKNNTAANFSGGLLCNIRTNSKNCHSKLLICTR